MAAAVAGDPGRRRLLGYRSVLLAFPTLRLFGIYTSLLTFSFAQVVQYVAVNDPRGLTGGSFGYPTVPAVPDALDQEAYLRNYYWTFGAVVWPVLRRRLAAPVASRHLPALAARRAGYAAARGVNPRVTRVVAFGLSGSWPASPARSTCRSSSRSPPARWG